jgi:3-oxoacyl-[acyl-carrier protein] reductase
MAVLLGAVLLVSIGAVTLLIALERPVESLSEAEQRMARALGVARFGQPDEIARLVAFLASPLAGFCQGSIVDADGGQTRTL